MPQIIVCEWRVIFSENLLHKTVYPLKDPWFEEPFVVTRIEASNEVLRTFRITIEAPLALYDFQNMGCNFWHVTVSVQSMLFFLLPQLPHYFVCPVLGWNRVQLTENSEFVKVHK